MCYMNHRHRNLDSMKITKNIGKDKRLRQKINNYISNRVTI